MKEKRKTTRWGLWVVVALVLLVAYPLSQGPVFWLCDHNEGAQLLYSYVGGYVYYPLRLLYNIGPFHDVMLRYLNFWSPLVGPTEPVFVGPLPPGIDLHPTNTDVLNDFLPNKSPDCPISR